MRVLTGGGLWDVNSRGSCWIPGSWDLPMTYNPIVVTLSSLKPFFFNGLKKELCFSVNAWSIRPRNPIRACSFIHAIEGHHRIFGAVVLRVIDFLPRKYTLNLGLATDYSRQVS